MVVDGTNEVRRGFKRGFEQIELFRFDVLLDKKRANLDLRLRTHQN